MRKQRNKIGSKSRTGGPKTPEGKAKALANLRPPFAAGNTLGRGRPAAGLSIREWLNEMQGWTEERIKAVLDSPKTPVAQKTAARTWLGACSVATLSSGAPAAGGDFDRVCDQTAGKPGQPVDVTTGGERMPAGYDLSRLSVDQLRILRDTLAAAQPAAENSIGGK